MGMEFVVEVNKKVYEISELVKDVSYTDRLNDGCSKLGFSYIDDNLKIENGCIVRFKYDDTGIFYGVVFKHGQNSKGEITVTAYDQLRYCKAKDTFSYSGYTMSILISKMCNYYGLISGKLADTGYVLKTKVVNNESWLDIIYSALSEILQNTGRLYVFRDEFGKVVLRNLEELELNAILGDYSLAYDYSYQKSIDDNFYNLIRIQDKKNKQFIEAKDKTSINNMGCSSILM